MGSSCSVGVAAVGILLGVDYGAISCAGSVDVLTALVWPSGHRPFSARCLVSNPTKLVIATVVFLRSVYTASLCTQKTAEKTRDIWPFFREIMALIPELTLLSHVYITAIVATSRSWLRTKAVIIATRFLVLGWNCTLKEPTLVRYAFHISIHPKDRPLDVGISTCDIVVPSLRS